MKRSDNYNFVIVNAKRLVAGPWYIESSLNVAVIGKYTAQLIEYLVSRGMVLSTVHLIGHSLGSHMAANVGAHLKSGNITRLTGKRLYYPIAIILTKFVHVQARAKKLGRKTIVNARYTVHMTYGTIIYNLYRVSH